ncbi:hypothetical protein KQI84_08295 [bacterium]|nr:hypothetical protein [bacterium]
MNPKPLNDLSHIPHWWRRLFPELEMLENNGLYAAFQSRRENTPRLRRNIISQRASAITFAVVSIVLYLLWEVTGNGWLVVAMMISVLLFVSLAVIRGKFTRKSGIPCSFLEVFPSGGLKDQAFLDLWQTPVNGRDIVGIVALDHLADWKNLVFLSALSLILPAALLAKFFGPKPLPIGIGIGLSVASIFGDYVLVRSRSIVQLRGFRDAVLQSACRISGRPAEGLRAQAENLPRIVLPLLLIIPIGIAVPCGVGGVGFLLDESPLLHPLVEWWNGHSVLLRYTLSIAIGLVLSTLIVCLTLLARRNRDEARRSTIQKYELWFNRALPILGRCVAGDDIPDSEFQSEILRAWWNLGPYGTNQPPAPPTHEKARVQR